MLSFIMHYPHYCKPSPKVLVFVNGLIPA